MKKVVILITFFMVLTGLAQKATKDTLYYQFNEKLDLYDTSHAVFKKDIV